MSGEKQRFTHRENRAADLSNPRKRDVSCFCRPQRRYRREEGGAEHVREVHPPNLEPGPRHAPLRNPAPEADPGHASQPNTRQENTPPCQSALWYGQVSGGVVGALAGGEPCAGPGEQGEPECGERVLSVVVGRSGLVAGQQGGQVRSCLDQVEHPGGGEGDAEDDQCCGDGEGAFRAGACVAMGSPVLAWSSVATSGEGEVGQAAEAGDGAVDGEWGEGAGLEVAQEESDG